MSEQRKVAPPTSIIFTPGDRVTYTGSKSRYLGGVGTVCKVKADACHVQFDNDPVLASGGVKTSLISFKELRRATSPD
jgi:hypothetical protein